MKRTICCLAGCLLLALMCLGRAQAEELSLASPGPWFDETAEFPPKPTRVARRRNQAEAQPTPEEQPPPLERGNAVFDEEVPVSPPPRPDVPRFTIKPGPGKKKQPPKPRFGVHPRRRPEEQQWQQQQQQQRRKMGSHPQRRRFRSSAMPRHFPGLQLRRPAFRRQRHVGFPSMRTFVDDFLSDMHSFHANHMLGGGFRPHFRVPMMGQGSMPSWSKPRRNDMFVDIDRFIDSVAAQHVLPARSRHSHRLSHTSSIGQLFPMLPLAPPLPDTVPGLSSMMPHLAALLRDEGPEREAFRSVLSPPTGEVSVLVVRLADEPSEETSEELPAPTGQEDLAAELPATEQAADADADVTILLEDTPAVDRDEVTTRAQDAVDMRQVHFEHACRGDAERLCAEHWDEGNLMATVYCLRGARDELTDGCQYVVDTSVFFACANDIIDGCMGASIEDTLRNALDLLDSDARQRKSDMQLSNPMSVCFNTMVRELAMTNFQQESRFSSRCSEALKAAWEATSKEPVLISEPVANGDAASTIDPSSSAPSHRTQNDTSTNVSTAGIFAIIVACIGVVAVASGIFFVYRRRSSGCTAMPMPAVQQEEIDPVDVTMETSVDVGTYVPPTNPEVTNEEGVLETEMKAVDSRDVQSHVPSTPPADIEPDQRTLEPAHEIEEEDGGTTVLYTSAEDEEPWQLS